MVISKSVQASHLCMVDSAKRDTTHFPTASQFDVVFDTPFHMVYGIDLLSVTIPRTEYNTSASRNTLAFSFGLPGVSQKHLVRVPEGDYDDASILTAVNAALAQYVSAGGNVVTMMNATAIQSVSNKVVFACAEVFTLYLSNSTLRTVIGFGDPVNPDSRGYSAPGWIVGGPDTVTSVFGPSSSATSATYTGPAASVAYSLTATSHVTQDFVSTFSGIITSVSVVAGAVGSPVSAIMYWTVVDASGQLMSEGTVTADVDSLTRVSTGMYSTANLPVVAGGSYTLRLADPNNTDASNCLTVYAGSDGGGDLQYLTASGQQTFSDMSVTGTIAVSPADHRVWAPGLIDLTGERYLILRCLEIETAINGSRAFEGHNAGIAFIQLGNYGYSQQGYDYSAYPPRTFHPISSLSRLSLSFQKPDGTLYDFQGLNLQLLMLVRYLVPQPTAPSNAHVPHYKTNLPEVNSRQLQDLIQHDPRYYWSPQSSLHLGMHRNLASVRR